MKNKLSGRFWCSLVLFSLTGQVAWVVENMYFNVFIYKIFNASAGDISLMVAASAVAATLTTVFIGALSDRLGKRKLFMCGGYILWGVSIFSFALIRLDVINVLFPAAASAAAVGVSLVIIMDCVMTFFGSSANDAAFNAWLTDSVDSSNRGAAEGINAMMPLVAILAVFGGFMAFDLDKSESWNIIFCVIGGTVLLVGIIGLFIIDEPRAKPSSEGYWSSIIYGFLPSAVRESPGLYLALAAFAVFNISIQIFMPYLIIYYEVSLGMADYVLVMAPAIIIASVITALWGKVYDKKGFSLTASVSVAVLAAGYIVLYFCRATLPVFAGSLLMMSGYLSGMAVFGAQLRERMPAGKAGRLQGVRIFSQVLIPGVVGPAIGRAVLSGAETITGSDGTSSFVPSADIFAAALLPLLLLIPLVPLISRFGGSRTRHLETPYEPGDVPHDYYPRPQLERAGFENLNGRWQLSVEKNGKPKPLGEILVPFPPESDASGIGRVTVKGETLIYERSFDFCGDGARTLLHFGAVDCFTSVTLNGKNAGEHSGGYLPFTLDVTDLIHEGENKICVRVSDPLDHDHPYGKQRYRRGGMWYTPVSGIWQTVWLECVPEKYIESIKISADLSEVKIETKGGVPEKTLLFEGREYKYSGDSFTFVPEKTLPWTPETPNIRRFTIRCGEDSISSYFAQREVSVGSAGGKEYILLNGRPYFFHGLLDQGYWSDGIFLPGNEAGWRDDILKMKELGFNMLRKHIKIEPDIFYYYCDIYGMAVFQDMVNSGDYSFIIDTALPTVGVKKGISHRASDKRRKIFLDTSLATADLLYSHPCVVYYTIFNEGWGQHDAAGYYARLRSHDPSRVWDTASGWFGGVPSDVSSEHVYFKPVDITPVQGKPMVLSEFGGYSCRIEEHSFNPGKSYGYRRCADTEAFMRDLEKLYAGEIVPMIRRGLCASVLTQLSDVEDETNGLLTYDRRVSKVGRERMLAIAGSIQSAFAKTTANSSGTKK